MKLFRFFQIMTRITLLSLVYINLQMQIFDLAYEAKKKEREIQRITDDNSTITYHILTLKSANHLGGKLLSDRTDMQFLDKDQIVRLETPPSVKDQSKAIVLKKDEKNPSGILSFFSLKSQAEAKPIKR